MGNFRVKYILSVATLLLFTQIVFGFAPTHRANSSEVAHTEKFLQDTVRPTQRREARAASNEARSNARRNARNNANDTIKDTVTVSDTLAITIPDSTVRQAKAALTMPITGRATDSLHYDLRTKRVYLYEKGEVTYDKFNLKADFMDIDLNTNNVLAYGRPDSVDSKPIMTRPMFTEGATSLNMDTIIYNMDSQRAKINNIATQQGDGWLIGQTVKKMEDNTINIADGMYTTCDQTDNPHFYYTMNKAKVIPNKKVIMGGGHLTIEEIDIPFLGLPEGFFPISSGPKSGILMPTYGEEARRGFYLRGLGYYFTFSDHMDLTLTGGYYTLGSWEAQAISRYMKRYKYSGNFNFNYASIRSGDKGDIDYVKQNTFQLQWTHSQDPKANPGSTFSASVMPLQAVSSGRRCLCIWWVLLPPPWWVICASAF